MVTRATLPCDGCGQQAAPEHIARRLRRLEWATRYRPVHISVLFLGGVMPESEDEFLYAVAGEGAARGTGRLRGEGRNILSTADVLELAEKQGKGRAGALAEFQHRGYFLTHILECPVEFAGESGEEREKTTEERLARQLPLALARIRRSLKPKRIALVSRGLDRLISRFAEGGLGAAILVNGGEAFALDGAEAISETEKLRRAVMATGDAGR